MSRAESIERLLELARRESRALSSAEEEFFRATAKGEIANYSADSNKENDPSNAQNWSADRVLSAVTVRWLCTDAREFVTYRGIQVKGARIDGVLDLNFAKIPFPLYF